MHSSRKRCALRAPWYRVFRLITEWKYGLSMGTGWEKPGIATSSDEELVEGTEYGVEGVHMRYKI